MFPNIILIFATIMKNKVTLAQEYGISPKTLVRRISTPELKTKLKEACYSDKDKFFTSKQEEIIKSYLGKPIK